jgi:CRISPR system Cascade subunit CasD
MFNKLGFLSLRLEGAFQSWGFDSQYDRRNTRMMPTRSAIAGMCCAALGFNRGSEDEQRFLAVDFPCLNMTSISIPRKLQKHASTRPNALTARRIGDYHTVQNTKTADGKTKKCHITHRFYLSDASFGVLLVGDYALLEKLSNALKDPVWGLWLGRKCCIPSAPIYAGLFSNENDALKVLADGKPLEEIAFEREAENFADGRDSIMDCPLSFKISNRRFFPRRIIPPGSM